MLEKFFQKSKEAGPEVKIVSQVPEEVKEKINKHYKVLLENHLASIPEEAKEDLKRLEYPKTKEQIELIKFANEKTNEIMEKCGVDSYDVPKDNLHIVPAEPYRKLLDDSSSVATTITEIQGVIYNAEGVRENDLIFGRVTFHEFMHLKSHLALEVTWDDEGEELLTKEGIYRSGLRIDSSFKKNRERNEHEHFRGLNEAVIAREEERFSENDLINLPMFKKERFQAPSDQKPKEGFISSGYGKHVDAYNYVLSEIQKELPEEYKDEEEVSLEFLKGFFTGKVLKMAKLVEKTFGKGSFRVLGMMGDDKNSAINTLETLKSLRRAKR